MQPEQRSVVLPSNSGDDSLHISVVGDDWTATQYTLFDSEERIFSVRSDHGSGLVSLLDFLNTASLTYSGIPEQRT